MKAIIYSKYGNPEVLQMKDVEKPVLGDNEVLVKIYVASVNSWDWDLLRGKPYLYRLIFGVFKPKHKIIGCDIAGRVELVGKNVKHLKAGDAVMGDISECWGGFAEYVCVPERLLTLKPSELSFEHAAAIPQAGVLALQSLQKSITVKSGDKVLINGAGGGVGTFALQIAKSLGAEVTCVDSYQKLEMLYNLGADHVIDYKQEDFAEKGSRYNLIIDVIANHSVFAYKEALLPNGRLVVIGGTIPCLLQVGLLGSLLSFNDNRKLGILIHEPNEGLDLLLDMIKKGDVKPVIDSIYTLKDVPIALQRLGDGKAVGKIVIKVSEYNDV
ncbi:alcohol dehydrogenase zinc-binding domain protein [Sporocytophaga myxococcoides]|uniref:Alcohol dehydrogenase zinc-binding domain protein n=1 Tax=Sporocytophaga myxococcoides TaxID=153721 RepID=A0A098LHF9_9BACT|nr:NAD(P)-dependent alcohol dehydrogenase [Sporocytophaga myxococcoides]GAL85879.1 alcohol dehydrogenase zinc-binding domain protein [Sporocytophaga myxococcoides]